MLRIIGMMLALLFVASGCQDEGEREPEKRGRVLLIGIDGTSPLLVGPMLKQGRLPNLARISQQGVAGRLRSVQPLYSPRIWTTIATGRRAEDHGIESFVVDQEAEATKLYASSDRKVPALWNILSDAGYTVGVVNWWTTYPPEKINGAIVSDHFFPEQISMIKRTFKDPRPDTAALVHPPDFEAKARELLDAEDLGVTIGNPFESELVLPGWLNLDLLSNFYVIDKRITRVALGIEESIHPDVLMILLPGIDRVSHWLWGNFEPEEKYPEQLRPSPEQRTGGAEALRRYYEFTDQLIGRLLDRYGPDDLVLVISDHGFEAGVSMMLLTGGHNSAASLDGVIFAQGAGVDTEAGNAVPLANVYQVAPMVLGWLGVPATRGMAQLPPFLAIDTPPRVKSYDHLEIERDSDAASGNEEEIIENLRALGYLEERAEESAGESAKDTPPVATDP